jgi:restriction system protein
VSRDIEPSAASLIASASQGSPHQAEVLIRRIGTSGGQDITEDDRKAVPTRRYLIQCKRFSVGSSVGAPVIRAFYGAVRADHKAVKGIFITTSSFTEQAKEFAENLAIELINREGLQQLLAEHGMLK